MIKILDKNWAIRKLYIPRPFYKFYGGHFPLKYTVFKKAICLLVLKESFLQYFNITCTDATLVFNMQQLLKTAKKKEERKHTWSYNSQNDFRNFADLCHFDKLFFPS